MYSQQTVTFRLLKVPIRISALIAIALLASMWACASPQRAKIGAPELLPGTPIYERPWTTDPRKFTFAIIGDKTGGGYENWPIFDHTVEEINRLRPDFAIMVGDLIQGYTEDSTQVAGQWEEFRQHATRLEVPFFYLPGNHDVKFAQGMHWWKKHIGRTYYDFTYQSCHFLVLNTDEIWQDRYEEDPSDGQRLFGVEQIRFAVKALDTHTDVRHTFVFMHKPAWWEDSEEWQQIEDALAGRPCSVFAGHQHKLKYELRNGGRYIVHGATGGSLNPSDVKELGQFHHYTLVTVDGNSVYLSIEEPGHAWPEDIAPIGFYHRARLVDSTEYEIRTLDDGRVAVDLGFGLHNALPKPVDFVIRPVIPPECAWHASVDSIGVHLAPESREWLRVTFTCLADDRAPVPAFTYFSLYDGKEMYRRGPILVSPFPDTLMRIVSDWQVVGPFDIPPVATEHLPEDPRRGVPGMFEPRGPDEGWSAGETYEEAGKTYRWQTASADSFGKLDFDTILGMRDNLLGYAACAVWSPTEQRVAARIRADNFMRMFVNGELIGELFASPYEYNYFPVRLKTGWNSLMVKLANNHGNWYLQFHLFDEQRNLRFASHRP